VEHPRSKRHAVRLAGVLTFSVLASLHIWQVPTWAHSWYVNRRGIFTPDRRAIETPLVDGVERVGDRSCGA
jgi:hypothetical protein